MKFLFTSLIFFSLLASFGQSPKQLSASKMERMILDTIVKLPECQKRAEYIEKHSKGKRHLSFVIYDKPSKDYPYYWVKAWEDNGLAYATHFNFYVYTDPLTIKYYDTVNDKVISLKQWRQQTKN